MKSERRVRLTGEPCEGTVGVETYTTLRDTTTTPRRDLVPTGQLLHTDPPQFGFGWTHCRSLINLLRENIYGGESVSFNIDGK